MLILCPQHRQSFHQGCIKLRLLRLRLIVPLRYALNRCTLSNVSEEVRPTYCVKKRCSHSLRYSYTLSSNPCRELVDHPRNALLTEACIPYELLTGYNEQIGVFKEIQLQKRWLLLKTAINGLNCWSNNAVLELIRSLQVTPIACNRYHIKRQNPSYR